MDTNYQNSDTKLLSELGFRVEETVPTLSDVMSVRSEADCVRFGIVRPSNQRKALALNELIRRTMEAGQEPNPLLKEPAEIANLLKPKAMGLSIEKFWTLTMNTRRRLINCVEVTSGTATASLAHPREVFRQAIIDGAACVAVVHNHPSGDPEPSSADVGITRQLREAARITGIELVDHIIIGQASHDPLGRGYFSFRMAGLM
jgi:DNA repair protein RadC